MARPNPILLCEEALRLTEELCRRAEGRETIKDQLLYAIAKVDRHLRETSFHQGKEEAVKELKAAEKACRDAEEWLSLLSRGVLLSNGEADRLDLLLKRIRKAVAASIRERQERLSKKAERAFVSLPTTRLLLKPIDGRCAVSLPDLLPEEEKKAIGLTCVDRGEAVSLVQERQENGGMLAVMRKSGESLVGIAGWQRGLPNPKALRITVGIRPELRRRGYGAEALRAVLDHVFGALGAEIAYAFTTTENDAARRLLRNCGFGESGALPCAAEDGGDVTIYSFSKSEWEKE